MVRGVEGWMGGWVDGWMGGWMDGWMGVKGDREKGWMNVRIEKEERGCRMVDRVGSKNRVDLGLSSVRTYARVRTCAHRHTFFKVCMYRFLYIILIIDFFSVGCCCF